MRQSQGEKFELMELVAENGDPAEIEQSDNLVAEQTKDHEALQESVNVLTQPRQAPGLTGHDATNDPPLSTSETGNTGTSTTPTREMSPVTCATSLWCVTTVTG